MRLQFLALIFCCCVLESCGTLGLQDLKKSSADKYFDARGFDRSKRKPLYNKKYISKARSNIIASDYEYEDNIDPENRSPSSKHIQMYRDMVYGQGSRNYRPKGDRGHEYYDQDEIDVPEARRRFAQSSSLQEDKKALENEIQEIKSLLEETRDHFAKVKCPISSSTNTQNLNTQDFFKQTSESSVNTSKDTTSKSKDTTSKPKDTTSKPKDTTSKSKDISKAKDTTSKPKNISKTRSKNTSRVKEKPKNNKITRKELKIEDS